MTKRSPQLTNWLSIDFHVDKKPLDCSKKRAWYYTIAYNKNLKNKH